MGSHGIKDRVAIVGMGCTAFGERFDTGLDDLLIDASNQAFTAAGIDKDAVDAYWFGTAQSGMSGITLARPLQLEGKPVTRVENFCATGSEALRQAAYAVASGAYDIAMAVGAEKVKDSGYAGLNAFPVPERRHRPHAHRGRDVQHGRAGVREEVRRRRRRAQGGAGPHRVEEPLQRRPQPAGAVPARDEHGARSATSPRVAGPLGILDCAGVADGAAAAIVVRAEDAHRYTDKPALREGAVVRGRQRRRAHRPGLRLHALPRGRGAARGTRTRRPGSPIPATSSRWPRCTTASPRPSSCSWRTSGSPSAAPRGRRCSRARFDLGGELPVNPDGGLKSFGHPVGASGLRMMFECWLQLRGEAPEDRRIGNDRSLALTHNLGGYPGEMVSFVSIVGREPS